MISLSEEFFFRLPFFDLVWNTNAVCGNSYGFMLMLVLFDPAYVWFLGGRDNQISQSQ